MTVRNRKFPLFIVILLAVLTTVVSACAPASATEGLKMAPMSEMSDEVRQAPVTVQEAYQFAVANPDVLTQLPCYCGCALLAPPHRSLRDCFLEEDGSYASHASGCLICTEIALAAVEAAGAGMSHGEIRALVDERFTGRGPSTNTALPAE